MKVLAIGSKTGARHPKMQACQPNRISPDSLATEAHIYLDHNSTTPVLPEVADAVREASLKYTANPGSQHEAGRRTRRALEQARQRVGELLGARMTGMDADRVIFHQRWY